MTKADPSCVVSEVGEVESAVAGERRPDHDDHRCGAVACLAAYGVHGGRVHGRCEDTTGITQLIDAASAVSADLVLSNELVPALCALLPGASFTVAGEPAQATLAPGVTIPLASCEVGAITYHPTLDALTLTSADGGIAVSAAGGCDLHGDCSITFTVQATNQFRFDRSAQQYSFASDPAPSVAHSTHIPWWYAMGGAVVLAIAETVASAVGNSLAALIGRGVAANGLSAEPPTTISFTGIQSFVTSAASWTPGGLLLQAGEQAPACP